MAQNNRLKYYISFEADTKKAKSQIDEMMRSLQQVNSPKNILNELISKEDLSQARSNVNQLQTMLKNAINVDTGRLDLTKLNQSLQKSNLSLSDFRKSFSALGVDGRNAFQQITRAVMQGEAPIRRQNALFDKMAETMRNTVRWQISATALNAFTTSIRNAYRYAEDLNRSLNDIRIVTGQSVEQMDAFATKANKAARELSVSTKAYADAALIFYQQGLDDNEVLERTNTVMKMSNVTGEAAADVSSYMTAIWNNFDDGSKSLEYYGDVITRLGAETAASSEEIAGGMEKFAAVANTVGLSYEYASAALATIIDRTRQSEDVVGTSLRTIFARLSSLSLGETLEDGVDLTKYSKALDTVGVKVLDQNGQLKEMDTILDELGTKWGGLNDAQKQALATTVAGVRQYSQLIALMDNYDLFKVNVDLAIDSEGTLTEQSKIFEESWLGAKKRVTAALEGIYDTLLDDKTFIFFTNGLASIIEIVDWLIDRAGGLPAALSLAGLMIQKVFGKDIKQIIDDIFVSINHYTGKTQKDIADLMQGFAKQNQYLQGEYDVSAAIADTLKQQADYLATVLKTTLVLNDEQRERLNLIQAELGMYDDTIIMANQVADEKMKAINNSKITKSKQPQTFKIDADDFASGNYSLAAALEGKTAGEQKDILKSLAAKGGNGKLFAEVSQFDARTSRGKDGISNLVNKFDKDAEVQRSFIASEYRKDFSKLGIKEDEVKNYLLNLKSLKEHEGALEEATKRRANTVNNLMQAQKDGNDVRASVYQKELDDIDKIIAKEQAAADASKERVNNVSQTTKTAVAEITGATDFSAEQQKASARIAKQEMSDMVSNSFAGTFKLVSGFSAVTAAVKTLSDESLTMGQRMTNFVTSISIGIPQIISGFNQLSQSLTYFTDPKVLKNLTNAFPVLEKLTGKATNLLGVIKNFSPYLLAAGAAFAVFKYRDEYLNPKNVLKKAEENTQKAKKAAREAAKEYNDLKNTLDGFTDKYNAIEDMVMGTEEWAAAVSEVNDNLQEVINKYGLISGEDFIIKNGMIVLTAAGEEKVLEGANANAEETKKVRQRAEKASIDYKDNNVDSLKNTIEEVIKNNSVLAELSMHDNGYASKQRVENIADYLKNNGKNQTSEEIISSLAKIAPELSIGELTKIATANEEMYIKDKNGYSSLYASNFAGSVANNKDLLASGLSQTDLTAAASSYYGEKLTQLASTISTTPEVLAKYGIEQTGINEYAKIIIGPNGEETPISLGTADRVKNYIAAEELGSSDEFLAISENITEIIKKATEDRANYKLRPEEAEEDFENLRQQRVESRKAKSEIDDKELNQYINYLDEFIDHTDEAKEAFTDEMLEELAVANMRFNKGMEDLLDNWTDYKQILNETHQGTEEYAETLNKMKQTMAEIAGVDTSDISEAFLLNTENQELLDKAYFGDLEAIYELRKNLAADFADDIGILNDDLSNAIDLLDMANTDIEVGMTFDDAAVKEVYGRIITIIQELMRVGDLTGEQAQKLLNTIGLAGKIKMVEVEAKDVNRLTNTTVIDGKEYTVTSDLTSEGKYHIPMLDESSLVVDKIQMNSANTQKAAGNKSSRNKDTKKADEEIERYHHIKEVIEDLNRELDRLGKEKDRAWGNAHLQYIDREIAKTQEAIDAQKEYLSQIEKNYGADRSKLAGYGAEFDENGRLTNYEELMQAQIDKYNAAVRSGSETQQEAAEEQFNNFKKALEQYEETADLFESEYEQLLDLQNQYYDKLLERIQYKVEVDVQISEEADKYYDYILDMLEDKAYSAAEAIAYLGKKTDESLKRIASYQEALNSMFEMHGFGDDAYERFANGELSIEELATAGFTSQEIDMLIEYRDALMEENKRLMEMRDQVMSSLTDTFDEYMDTLDKMIDKFDHLNAVTSAYKNIVDIVGKEALDISNEMMQAMDEATVATATNTLKASKDRLDAAEAAMADMKTFEADYREAMAKANAATTEEDKIYWETEAERLSDAMEHIKEESQAAKEAFLGDWEEALTKAREVFENNVQLAMEEFEDAVSGIYGSLDAMKEAYDQNKVLREQYLEEYERIYELNKLNRDITNSMDDIDSIAAKQTLRDLQEEINELQRSGAQISKYDLDMLRMRYELRLAEIALEDAQNAKSQVRMSRDNDGNWSYVYTADEATVADAQQSYEDKMFQMQQTSNDYLDQISEQWIATTIEMEQAYQKIYEDRTLSDEERMAAIDRLTEYYDARFLYFNDQITNALGNNQVLYEEDWLSWANKNNLQIESNNSFQTSFDNTVLGLTTGFTTIDGLHQQLINAVGSPEGGGYLGSLQTNYNKWQADVNKIMEAAGTSVEGFGTQFSNVADETVRKSEEIAGEVDTMADTMEDAFGDVVDAVQDWRDEYSNAIADNIDANSRMISSLGALLAQINKTIDAQIKLNSVTGEGPTSTSGGYDGGGNNPSGTSIQKYKIWREDTGEIYAQNLTKEEADAIYYSRAIGGDTGLNRHHNPDGSFGDYIYKIAKMATGGYTGAWGDNGKLAVLHEKELVLNKDDTANFLSAINIVRDIVKVVDMNAAISGMGIGALAAGGIAGAGSTIEQSVTIYADFPNATDHSEIELALANLMNSASQYANRKG